MIARRGALVIAALVAGCASSVELAPEHVELLIADGIPACLELADDGTCELFDASFIQLVARPELFDGHRVTVTGFANLQFEGNALYASEELYRHGSSRDAIWLDVEGIAVRPAFRRGYARVEGRFTAGPAGHFGLFAGAIGAITKFDASIERRAADAGLQDANRASLIDVVWTRVDPQARATTGLSVIAERTVWCGPGWRTEFRAAAARQRVRDTCIEPRDYERQYSVAANDWRRVSEAIEQAGFWQLPERVEALNENGTITIVTDDDVLCIEVRDDGRTHRVCGMLYAIEHTAPGKRFLDVWRALTRVAPEPGR